MREKIFPLKNIIESLKKQGAHCYLVGGSVRDIVFYANKKTYKQPHSDVDIEVHNINLEKLIETVSFFGKTSLIGKQFGIVRLHNYDIDFSVPRKDSIGRKPNVEIIPHIGIEKALERRDITINAMAIDLTWLCENFDAVLKAISSPTINLTKDLKIIDPYKGLEDLQNKIVRPVHNKKFKQDPLRLLRVMQMISRFELKSTPETDQILQNIELIDKNQKMLISPERVADEFTKLLLQSQKPSLGICWLHSIGKLEELFPAVKNLVQTTISSVDTMARKLYEEKTSEPEKLALMMAALLHDYSTITIQSIFKRLSMHKTLMHCIVSLVKFNHIDLAKTTDLKAKMLAFKLSPFPSLRKGLLLQLTTKKITVAVFEKLSTRFQKLKILDKPIKPLITGKDLISTYDPGPDMGKKISKAYDIQLKNCFTRKKDIMSKLKKSSKKILHQDS